MAKLIAKETKDKWEGGPNAARNVCGQFFIDKYSFSLSVQKVWQKKYTKMSKAITLFVNKYYLPTNLTSLSRLPHTAKRGHDKGGKVLLGLL